VIEGEDLALFVRSIANATGRATGRELDAALDALGWADALSTDPRAAVSVLFAHQGAANATSSALGTVVAHALGLGDVPGSRIVLPEVGRSAPPGTGAGDLVHIRGLAPGALGDQQDALVVTSESAGLGVIRVPTTSLGMRPVAGLDPSLTLLEVTGEAVRTSDARDVAAADWAAAVSVGRLALAHELVGASRTMLGLACEHASERIQFGRPIASFQAVRHRLAETLVAVEMAEAMLDAAWLDRTPEMAAMAKAVAGHEARTAARHCQQVLAGIGFTVEHPLHRYVRRTLVLDQLLGSAASLTTALGNDLIDRRLLPPLLPL